MTFFKSLAPYLRPAKPSIDFHSSSHVFYSANGRKREIRTKLGEYSYEPFYSKALGVQRLLDVLVICPIFPEELVF